ncbi:MAG: hypothetical protein HF978_08945 [Desulfobacteraceae bacterium]|nr:hypothetical protein [Desulfobacteraceae bacterium]MBC2755660.1 hypothetical protein [Desulfobacteraceae bacterium]
MPEIKLNVIITKQQFLDKIGADFYARDSVAGKNYTQPIFENDQLIRDFDIVLTPT